MIAVHSFFRAAASSIVTAFLLPACTDGSERPRASSEAGNPSEAGIRDAVLDRTGFGFRDAAVNDATLDGCHPPVGATTLCLTFDPERIDPEPEPGLDQRGYLSLQVFDRPVPTGSPLYERSIPPVAESGEELSLDELPVPTIVLSDAPATVYVRALFFDSGGFDEYGGTQWGTWLGGVDLSRGLSEDTGLIPLSLSPGEAITHVMSLVAMRRLIVTVTTSASPVGDGEGALSIVASREEGLPPRVPTHGYGIDPCVDVTKGPAAVPVVVLGHGTFYVTGFFDDLGIETPGEVPPGTMLSIRDVDLTAGQATYDQVTLTERQYSQTLSIDLGYVTELRGDPSAIGPNSCADLGFLGAP